MKTPRPVFKSSLPIAALLLSAGAFAACLKPKGSVTASVDQTTTVKNASARLSKEEVAHRFQQLQINALPFDTEALNVAAKPPLDTLPQAPAAATKLKIDGSLNLLGSPAAVDVDLLEFDTPPKDQERNGWCSAFAISSAIENLAKQDGHNLDLSETDLWMKYREAWTPTALVAASSSYVVPERYWPYDTAQPIAGASGAGVAKIRDYEQINSGVSAIAAALRAKHPVVFVMQLSSTFQEDYQRHRGLVRSQPNTSDGFHVVEVSGIRYNAQADGGGYFIFKNSWGDAGDAGYGYVPFNYCKNFECYAWEIKSIDLKLDHANLGAPVPNVSSYQVLLSLTARANGDHAFSLALDPDSGDLSQVDHVVYLIDPSFGDGEFAQVDNAEHQFSTGAYVTRVNHWSTAGVKIYLKDGTVIRRAGLPVSWK